MLKLSPSGIKTWLTDRVSFYIKYLSPIESDRLPQTQPMSIGSAFDARVKNYLHEKLIGKAPEFEFTTLFESQVEPQNRDWALEHSNTVFNAYMLHGCVADLIYELEKAEIQPRFEFRVEAHIPHCAELEGVLLVGYPDIYFKTKNYHVVYDWKVNGYCSRGAQSPKPGYVMTKDCWDTALAKHSRTNGKWHKNAQLAEKDGLVVNVAGGFENIDESWALQTTIYGWQLGAEVGSELISGVDQLVFKDVGGIKQLRNSRFRGLPSKAFQARLVKEIGIIRDSIAMNHIFTDLTLEESQAKAESIDALLEVERSDPNGFMLRQMRESEAGFNYTTKMFND